MLALAFVALAAPPTLEIFVPLCDGAQLACGRGAAGDPRSLEGNLYWGAAYGAERYLAKSFKLVEKQDAPGGAGVLRRVVLERPDKIRLVIWAYAGEAIDQALADFLHAASGKSSADMVVWAGHDRLMDVDAPSVHKGTGKPTVVLACESEHYFGPALAAVGATPIALTRTFMAPEAYLLEALATTVAERGTSDKPAVRAALIAAYARFQKLSERAAASVFSKL